MKFGTYRGLNEALEQARVELKPVYHHYTDAVIAMVGPLCHPAVFEALKNSDLTEAEAAHAYHFGNSDNCTKKCRNHTQLRRWARPLSPSWLLKPLPTIPRKNNNIVVARIDSHRVGAYLAEKQIGIAEASYAELSEGADMMISLVKQDTRKLSSKDARKVEGWKNVLVETLEKEARDKGARRALFNIGAAHITSNASRKPIHPEILETYGRLPMQHGYQLKITERNKLMWLKEL